VPYFIIQQFQHIMFVEVMFSLLAITIVKKPDNKKSMNQDPTALQTLTGYSDDGFVPHSNNRSRGNMLIERRFCCFVALCFMLSKKITSSLF